MYASLLLHVRNCNRISDLLHPSWDNVVMCYTSQKALIIKIIYVQSCLFYNIITKTAKNKAHTKRSLDIVKILITQGLDGMAVTLE